MPPKKSEEHKKCEEALKEAEAMIEKAGEEIEALQVNRKEIEEKVAEVEAKFADLKVVNDELMKAAEVRKEADESLAIDRERAEKKIADLEAQLEKTKEHVAHLEAVNEDQAKKLGDDAAGVLDVTDPIPAYEELRASGMEPVEASAHVEKAYQEAGTSFGTEKKLAYRIVGPKGGFWRIKRKFTLEPTTIPLSDLSDEEIEELKGTPAKFISIQLVRI